jgi:hypothetical protein
MKPANFFLINSILCKKARFFHKNVFENCAFCGLDTQPKLEPEP